MDHFAGLDVSVKETSVCIVDETGRIVREGKVVNEPRALLLDAWGRLNVVTPFHHLSEDSHTICPLGARPITASSHVESKFAAL